jgi:hypothetical protein
MKISRESHTKRTLVARESTLGAGTVIRIPTDTADIVFRHVPSPCCDGVPLLDGDFHGGISFWSSREVERDRPVVY